MKLIDTNINAASLRQLSKEYNSDEKIKHRAEKRVSQISQVFIAILEELQTAASQGKANWPLAVIDRYCEKYCVTLNTQERAVVETSLRELGFVIKATKISWEYHL